MYSTWTCTFPLPQSLKESPLLLFDYLRLIPSYFTTMVNHVVVFIKRWETVGWFRQHLWDEQQVISAAVTEARHRKGQQNDHQVNTEMAHSRSFSLHIFPIWLLLAIKRPLTKALLYNMHGHRFSKSIYVQLKLNFSVQVILYADSPQISFRFFYCNLYLFWMLLTTLKSSPLYLVGNPTLKSFKGKIVLFLFS